MEAQVTIETTKPRNDHFPQPGMPLGYTPPGSRFMVPESVADRLVQYGEARVVVAEDLAAEKPAVVEDPAPVEETTEETEILESDPEDLDDRHVTGEEPLPRKRGRASKRR